MNREMMTSIGLAAVSIAVLLSAFHFVTFYGLTVRAEPQARQIERLEKLPPVISAEFIRRHQLQPGTGDALWVDAARVVVVGEDGRVYRLSDVLRAMLEEGEAAKERK